MLNLSLYLCRAESEFETVTEFEIFHEYQPKILFCMLGYLGGGLCTKSAFK